MSASASSVLYDPKRADETAGPILTYDQDSRRSRFCVFCPADSHSHQARCCGEDCPNYVCPATLADLTAYCHDPRCSSQHPRPVFCDGVDACRVMCHLCEESQKPSSFCDKHSCVCENCGETVCMSHSHSTDSESPEENSEGGDDSERLCHECHERMIVD